MKIGLVSYEFRNNDISFNLSQIEKAIVRTKGTVDLLCFGEAFLQGFDSLSWSYEKDKEIAVSRDSDVMDQICALSLWGRVGLLLGYIEKDEDSLYSSCALVEEGKIVHNYRRISKGWKEFSVTDGHYQEGTAAEEFTYHGYKVMVALCGDLWDLPERFQTDGILIWPVYVNFSLEDWSREEPEYAKQARLAAHEVFMVNSITSDPKSYGGAFHFKDGELVSKTSYGEEDILIVTV